MNRGGIFLLILAIIVAAITTWLNSYWLSYKDFQFSRKEKKIDYYLSDFTLLNVHSDGTMRYLVKGEHLIHQQKNNSSELFEPLLQAQNKKGVITTMTAKKALQKKDNGPITLVGKVDIVKNAISTENKIQFSTRDLIYNPLKETLKSDTKVTISSSFGYIKGVGLSSKLNEQEIRILSNVQTEFNPAK